jgi:acyl-CoA synthetase (AMP-forming)/AMP-acid ligase II
METTEVGGDRIHQLIDHWAQISPDACALEEGARQLQYKELAAASRDVADRLRDAGVRGGDRVLLIAENSVALCVLLFALSRLDAWAVIVNARISPREVENVATHCDARRAIFTSSVSAEAAAHAAHFKAQAVDWPVVGSIALGSLKEAARCEPLDAGAKQVAVMIYTSGTVGAPKGVMVTHSSLLFLANSLLRLRSITPEDRSYGALPYSHIAGLAQLLSTMAGGATSVIQSRYTPHALAQALSEKGISLMGGVPAMFAKLFEWQNKSGAPIQAPNLRYCSAGGAPVTESLKREFEKVFGIPLNNAYGMTECTPISYTRPGSPHDDCSVGAPADGMEVRLVGPDGNDVPGGMVGEIWVRGPAVMKGYYKEPDLTRQALDAQGWLKTGDLARQTTDGSLVIAGRSKELIIRSGFKVYPLEVEQVLNSHPLVVQSAVVGRAVDGNEEVIAFVEYKPVSGLTSGALERFLREHLAPYKVPSAVVLLEQLPAAPTGKVLKSTLQKMARELPPA